MGHSSESQKLGLEERDSESKRKEEREREREKERRGCTCLLGWDKDSAICSIIFQR